MAPGCQVILTPAPAAMAQLSSPDSSQDDICEVFTDTICSVCHRRLLVSEIAYGQGEGIMPKTGEVINIVCCSDCYQEEGVPVQLWKGDGIACTPKRMDHELQLEAAAAKACAAEAIAQTLAEEKAEAASRAIAAEEKAKALEETGKVLDKERDEANSRAFAEQEKSEVLRAENAALREELERFRQMVAASAGLGSAP